MHNTIYSTFTSMSSFKLRKHFIIICDIDLKNLSNQNIPYYENSVHLLRKLNQIIINFFNNLWL